MLVLLTTGRYNLPILRDRQCQMFILTKQTPWSESASELYRPSDRRLSAKWLPAFADKGCHVVSMTDPYGRILGFLDRSRYFSIKYLLSCTHEAEWTPFQTHYIFFDRLCGLVVRVLGYRSGGPGSIPGTTKKCLYCFPQRIRALVSLKGTGVYNWKSEQTEERTPGHLWEISMGSSCH
jgi:hypothetical protein